MYIGNVTVAHLYKLNKQHLAVNFFTIGFPLFPLKSYWVIDQKAIPVPTQKENTFHCYSRYLFGFAGLGISAVGHNTYGFGENIFLYVLLVGLGVLLIISCAYSWLAFGSSSEKEFKQRKVFGEVLPINALPQYLPLSLQEQLYQDLENRYAAKYQTNDWASDINNNNIKKDNFKLLYTLAYYHKTIHPYADAEALFEKIDGLVRK